MKKQVVIPQEQIDFASQGDKSAIDCLNYMINSTGVAAHVCVTKTLDALGDKGIKGKLLGDFWDISGKDIMIFTKLILYLPNDIAFVLSIIGHIPTEIRGEFEKMSNDMKLSATESGVYRENKSDYYQDL
jgi:hypothetical protein